MREIREGLRHLLDINQGLAREIHAGLHHPVDILQGLTRGEKLSGILSLTREIKVGLSLDIHLVLTTGERLSAGLRSALQTTAEMLQDKLAKIGWTVMRGIEEPQPGDRFHHLHKGDHHQREDLLPRDNHQGHTSLGNRIVMRQIPTTVSPAPVWQLMSSLKLKKAAPQCHQLSSW